MKWGGIDATTPANDAPGAMTMVQNARMAVAGELRRRRGMARTTLAKGNGPITGIADFALSPGNPYALTLVSSAINGDIGISSQWSDAALSPLSGTSSAAGAVYTLTVNRGTSQYATSAIIFANAGAYPTDAALGTYVGEVAMSPWAASASTTWTAPDQGTWYFRVYPVRERLVGPGANMTPVNMGGFIAGDAISHAIIQISPALDLGCTLAGAGLPLAYVQDNGTGPTFLLGNALAAGACTLPLTYTLTPGASGGGGPGVQIFATRTWTSALMLLPPSVTAGVACATVTATTGRNIALT